MLNCLIRNFSAVSLASIVGTAPYKVILHRGSPVSSSRPKMTDSKGATGEWYKESHNIDGVLLDIYGVLYDAGVDGDVAIPGSVEALKKLNEAGIPVRLCSNTSNNTQKTIACKLRKLGYQVKDNHIFNPIPAVHQVLKERQMRPYLLMDPDIVSEFSDIDQTNPDCVVMGDATDEFTYKNMNKAFHVLLESEKPHLITLGAGKYYKDVTEMKLDVGSFGRVLEYACNIEAEVVGKPAKSFFAAALKDMDVKPERAVMIGDDIVSDVGGAQACGLKGVQVRTGKYRASDEPHAAVKPDGYVDNLLQAVDLFLQHKS